MWDLVPWPGIEPGPLALEAQSLNHWTTREAPGADEYNEDRRLWCYLTSLKQKKKPIVSWSQLICKSFFFALLCFSMLILIIEWKSGKDIWQYIIIHVTLSFKGELESRSFHSLHKNWSLSQPWSHPLFPHLALEIRPTEREGHHEKLKPFKAGWIHHGPRATSWTDQHTYLCSLSSVCQPCPSVHSPVTRCSWCWRGWRPCGECAVGWWLGRCYSSPLCWWERRCWETLGMEYSWGMGRDRPC